MKPLISIIIPTFNEEKFIGRCLESICVQDVKDKIEVLIIDDDSTDETLEIAKSFSKKLNVKIIRNGTKDPERGKKIGLVRARGKFFMYLDADMTYASKNWFSASLKPLNENKKIIGCLASFGVNPKHNAITRCISYDVFQRDPIFRAFTPDIKKSIIESKKDYFVCKFTEENIPCQSLCLYRTKILKSIFKEDYHLMDNDVPIILVEKGYNLFAFCPKVRIYHFLLNNLEELFKKRMRGALRTYMANFPKRRYKWLNLDKKRNIFLLGLWVVYANLILPATIYGAYQSIKHGDISCMAEPAITLVSTDSLIYAFLRSGAGFRSLLRM